MPWIRYPFSARFWPNLTHVNVAKLSTQAWLVNISSRLLFVVHSGTEVIRDAAASSGRRPSLELRSSSCGHIVLS